MDEGMEVSGRRPDETYDWTTLPESTGTSRTPRAKHPAHGSQPRPWRKAPGVATVEETSEAQMVEGVESIPERHAPVPRSERYEKLLGRLEKISGLSRSEAERSAATVLCLLEKRLTIADAADLEQQLPEALDELLDTCRLNDEARPLKMTKRDFVWRLTEELGVSDPEAERRIYFVFQTFREEVSEEEARTVERLLPDDLRAMWRRPA